jgi:hypothetical protein
MPFIAGCRKTPADLVGKAPTEFQSPLSHGFMADLNSTGGEHLLDHPQAQGKPEIQPLGVADHFSWEAVAGIARMIGLPPPLTLPASRHLPLKLTGSTIPVSRQVAVFRGRTRRNLWQFQVKQHDL